MLKSFATTVVTPLKWPGREAPQSGVVSSCTVTSVRKPGGYISSTDGAKTTSTPASRAWLKSPDMSRGYVAKSSCGPNCLGLTKIDITTTSHSRRAACTRLMWPACKYPIVGTRPIRLPAARCAAKNLRNPLTVSQICIHLRPPTCFFPSPVARGAGPALGSSSGSAIGPLPLEFLGVQIPANEHQYRLCWSRLLALAQLHPLVYTLDNDGRCLILTPQDALEAHQLMAAAFDNEQQPEFESVHIQGDIHAEGQRAHSIGMGLSMLVSVVRMRCQGAT